jgi:hypothetical protein
MAQQKERACAAGVDDRLCQRRQSASQTVSRAILKTLTPTSPVIWGFSLSKRGNRNMNYSLFFNAAARRKQTNIKTTPISQLGTDVITIAVYGTLAAIAVLAYLS